MNLHLRYNKLNEENKIPLERISKIKKRNKNLHIFRVIIISQGTNCQSGKENKFQFILCNSKLQATLITHLILIHSLIRSKSNQRHHL